MAIPTSASASAGASLTPSPTITTPAPPDRARSSLNQLHLLFRGQLWMHLLDSCLIRDCIRDGRLVAGGEHDVADPVLIQPIGQARRIGSQAVGDADPARVPAVDRNLHLRPSRHRLAFRNVDALCAQIGATADGDQPSRSRDREHPAQATPRRPPGTSAGSIGTPPPRPAPRRQYGSTPDPATPPRRAGRWRRDGGSGCRASTVGVPSVSVPVLSSSTVRAAASRSITPAPLTMTPARAARDTPETSATGAARISGHGVATTSTATARTGSPDASQAAAARTTVSTRNHTA